MGKRPFSGSGPYGSKTERSPQIPCWGTPFAYGEKGRGIKVADWLLEHGLDQIIVIRNLGGKGSGLTLTNAGTEITVVVEKDADKVLSAAVARRKPSKVV